mgnify:CR=1 FL=1
MIFVGGASLWQVTAMDHGVIQAFFGYRVAIGRGNISCLDYFREVQCIRGEDEEVKRETHNIDR